MSGMKGELGGGDGGGLAGWDLPPAAVDIEPKRPPNGDRRCSGSVIVIELSDCVVGGKISGAKDPH